VESVQEASKKYKETEQEARDEECDMFFDEVQRPGGSVKQSRMALLSDIHWIWRAVSL